MHWELLPGNLGYPADLAAYVAAETARLHGLRVLDDPQSIIICCDKVHMYKRLLNAEVPMPDTEFLEKKDVTPEHAERIRRYLAEKPRGKFGTHRYRPEEWGFDAAELRERFRPYTEHLGTHTGEQVTPMMHVELASGYIPVMQIVMTKRYLIPGLHIDTGVGTVTPQNVASIKPLIDQGIR